jgi:hypothetical protein
MEVIHMILTSAATVIELVGLFLLAREVLRGQNMEDLSGDFVSAKRLLFLYTAKNYEGFLTQCRLDAGDTPAQAQAWVVPLAGTIELQNSVNAQWSTLGPRLVAAIDRWENRTAPEVMRRRKIDLSVGTVLLMGSAVIHAFLQIWIGTMG